MSDLKVVYGTFPIGWRNMRIKHFYDLYSGGTPLTSNDDNYNDEGVCFVNISDMTNVEYIYNTNKRVTDKGIKEKNLRILDPGTILYSIYASLGSVSELSINATISQAILALIPKTANVMDKSYFKMLLGILKENISYFSNGTTQSNLNADIVKSLPILVPNIYEQTKIQTFVNKRTLILNQLIYNQQHQLEKLKEYKQSLISEIVTKGLDLNAELKDSGYDWIGPIQAKSKICKIKNLYNVDLGKMLSNSKTRSNDTYENYLKAKNIQWDYIDASNISKMWFTEEDKEKLLLNEGDILVTEGGAAGTASIYRNEAAPCYIQNAVHRLNAKNDNLNKYLYYWMFTIVNRGYTEFVCNKATFLHYTKEKIINTPIIEQSKSNQVSIVSFLDKKCQMIDKLIELKNNKIEELNYYRKSLIYEYVTGKKVVS